MRCGFAVSKIDFSNHSRETFASWLVCWSSRWKLAVFTRVEKYFRCCWFAELPRISSSTQSSPERMQSLFNVRYDSISSWLRPFVFLPIVSDWVAHHSFPSQSLFSSGSTHQIAWTIVASFLWVQIESISLVTHWAASTWSLSTSLAISFRVWKDHTLKQWSQQAWLLSCPWLSLLPLCKFYD